MRHDLPRSLLMHPAQPRPASNNSNPLPKEDKDKQRQIIRQQYRHKDPPNHNRIPPQQNPIQQVKSHPEADRLLPEVHRDEHLARVRRVRINSVSEREGEVEERRPVDHCHAGEVPEPVQVMLRCHAVDEESCRSDQHRDEQDAKSHLRFADVVVLSRQVGG